MEKILTNIANTKQRKFVEIAGIRILEVK